MKKTILFAAMLVSATAVMAQMKKSDKRGVGEEGFGYGPEITALAPGVTWTYNWGTNPAKNVAEKLRPGEKNEMEFVPMIWNGNFNEKAVRDSLTKYPGTKYLLGFNEPNFKSQANMTPSQAADLWPVLENIASDFNLGLVAPALNYPDGPINDGVTYQPEAWMDSFIAAYKEKFGREPRLDYMALHCYMNNPNSQKGFVDNFAKKYGKQVWLTEFCSWEGTVDSISQLRAMITKVQDLELDENVHRYAWFKAKGSAAAPFYRLLINQNLLTHKPDWGTLSQLGKVYVNMSSFDTSYYNPVGVEFSAKDYVNSAGITLGLNTDAESSQIIQVEGFDTGTWLEYLVDVPATGEYTLYVRMASEKFLFDPLLQVFIDDEKIAEQGFPASGPASDKSDVWVTNSMKVQLNAGKQRIRLRSGQSTTCKLGSLRIVSNGSSAISSVGGTVGVREVKMYSVNGAQVSAPQKGVTIRRTLYTDGTVRTEKIMTN